MGVNNILDSLGFPIGSGVVMVGEDPNRTIKIGEIGIVCDYHKYSDGCDIGVAWEVKRAANHNCFGKCENGHGRYVPHASISIVDLDLGELDMSELSVSALLGITS